MKLLISNEAQLISCSKIQLLRTLWLFKLSSENFAKSKTKSRVDYLSDLYFIVCLLSIIVLANY